MKRTLKIMMVALIAAATLGLTACTEKEHNGSTPENPDLPTYQTLENTEWEGTYTTSTQTPQGTMAMTIRWTLDFMQGGKAAVMMVFESQAFDDTPYDWTSTYTFDPTTGTGVLSDENLGSVNFTVDAVNRTMNAKLVIYVQHEEGGEGIAYGGETTLHQVH